MQILELQRKSIDLSAFKMRSAIEGDYDLLIDEPTVIMENGKIAIVYMTLDTDCSDVVQALQEIEYETGYRTDGLKSTSAVLGYLPRNTIRRDYCTATRLAVQQPKQHAVVARYAAVVNEYYRRINPELFERHVHDTVQHVVADYTIKDSVFTSGIINKNNPLKYHFDTGNFSEVWSCMLVFKHDVEGGYLSCPEFGLGFALRNNSLLMFDGQQILHGVTPIKRKTPEAYRYSIVYYSMRQMWGCEPLNDEVIRIRNKKSERERKRAEHIKHVNVDMNAPVQYPIFVLAHGPYRAAKTPAILRGCKLPYTVVVRESDAPQYQRDFPNAHLLIVSNDVDMEAFIQSYTHEHGIDAYWLMPDHVSGFQVVRDGVAYPVTANAVMYAIEAITPVSCIAAANTSNQPIAVRLIRTNAIGDAVVVPDMIARTANKLNRA